MIATIYIVIILLIVWLIGKFVEWFIKKYKNNTNILPEVKTEQIINDTPIKKEISEERKKLFTGVWDSRRLLSELLRITKSVKGLQIELYEIDSEQTPYSIRCKRVFSAINAFRIYGKNNHPIDRISLEELISEDCSEIKMSELTSLIEDFVPEYRDRMRIAFNPDRKDISRSQLFRFLFSYRFESYKLYTHWDNILETNIAGGIAIDITRKLYDENLKSINDVLDKYLLLLMGDDFDKTFTEKELLENCDYPNVTDAELYEMDLEYC